MEFRLLGPLEVLADDRLLPLGPPKQRAVLGVLLLRRNELVPTATLVDELWGERPPTTAVKVLQGYVSRLRRVLGETAIETQPLGYLLRVEHGALDLDRFQELLERGRTLLAGGAVAEAASALREALGLWRGPPLADFTYEPFARNEIGRLTDLRLVALEERVEADLELGRVAGLVGELEALIAEHPHRERLRGQLMLALYRSGRQTEAAAVYRDTRAALAELGIEPGPTLRQLERQVLTQDAALEPARTALLAPTLGERVPLPGPLVPASPFPFVGRTSELGTLHALLARAAQGEGGVVLLGGEAGAGKSRLIRELAHGAANDGVLVCYGSSDAAVSAPYEPVREWLAFLLRVAEPAALRQCLDGNGEQLARLVPGLERLTGTPAAAGGEAEGDRLHLQLAVTEVLTRLSRLQPLLLVADDFHWADGETLHLLRRLARAAPEARLLLVAAFRERDDEIRGALHETFVDLLRLDGVTRLSLANLSATDMRAFVRASTDAEATAELATTLDTLTGGNPLLLCELWRELVDSDDVEVDGRVGLKRPLAELRVSERVGEIVNQRLLRLAPATAALVELAAVIGTRFEGRVLAEAARHEQGAAGTLEQALEAGFFEELPDPVTAWRFTHELVRRAVYDRIKPARRAELHLRVGKALERIHRRDRDRVLPELAHHFTLAAPVAGPGRGVKYNLRAANAALATAALTERAAWLNSAARLKNQRQRELRSSDPTELARYHLRFTRQP